MRHSNIWDPVQQQLDQRVFDGTNPRPKIVKFISDLYYDAARKLLDDPEKYIDLYLTGSLTTYQWSDTSDCDISVFPNWNSITQEAGTPPDEVRAQLIKLHIDHLDGTFLPGGSHPLQFFAVNQDITPDIQFQPGIRSGWSFKHKHWLVPPERDRVHDIETELPDLYQRAHDIADKMTTMLDHDPDSALKLWKQVHKKRQLDQRAGLGDFCLAPGTKILRADYSWIDIEDIEVGDVLVGFDEEPVRDPGQRGKQRTFQPAIVSSKTPAVLPSYRVTTTNGAVISSAAHKWLVRNKKRLVVWRETSELQPGDIILRFSELWGESEDPIKAAYVAGIFDGEGHMTRAGRLSFSQKEGVVRRQTQDYLHDLGFDFCSHRRQDDSYDWAWNMQIYGGVKDTMRFLHQIPTVRVGRDRSSWWVGRSITPKNRYAHSEESIARVLEIEDIGLHEVIGLGTTTGTLIAEGLFSSNSEGNTTYKYLVHIGIVDRLRSELHLQIETKVAKHPADYVPHRAQERARLD
jgi:hypothetical protein